MSRRVLLVLMGVVLVLLPLACKSGNSPTSPGGSAPPPAPAATATPTGIPGTPTYTGTVSYTPTFTYSPTATFTPTTSWDYCSPFTCTDTATYSPTETYTPTPTYSPTETYTSTDTYTPTPTRTFTPSFTATPTRAIVWHMAYVARMDLVDSDGSFGEEAMLYLRVNGSPDATAAVTMIGSNGTTVILGYSGTTELDSLVYAQYWNDTDVVYQPGVVYTFITQTSAGTATGVVTAAGNITHALDGLHSYWQLEGNNDIVRVYDSAMSQVYQSPGDDVASGFAVPATAIDCSGAVLQTEVTARSVSIVNAGLVDYIYAGDLLAQDVASPCTPLSTPTRTFSPTRTPTPGGPIPTFTPTPTPFPFGVIMLPLYQAGLVGRPGPVSFMGMVIGATLPVTYYVPTPQPTPPGLSLATDNSGNLDGTPTTAGSYVFTLCVRDAAGHQACEPATVNIMHCDFNVTASLSSRTGPDGDGYYLSVYDIVMTGTATGPVSSLIRFWGYQCTFTGYSSSPEWSQYDVFPHIRMRGVGESVTVHFSAHQSHSLYGKLDALYGQEVSLFMQSDPGYIDEFRLDKSVTFTY